MPKALATITYSSIVTRERVKIALIIATLNDFEVKSGDILLQRRCGLLWVQSLVKMPERLQ